MPYIPKDRRGEARVLPQNVGELTYRLTDASLQYLDWCSERDTGMSYQDLADVTAALIQTLFCIQSRVVDLYENDKRFVNGDLPIAQQVRGKLYDRIWDDQRQSRQRTK